MDFTQLRRDVETYAAALSREEYLTLSGQQDESRSALVRERFPALGSRGLFEEVWGETQGSSDPEARGALRALAEFLGTSCIDHRVRVLTDRIRSAEAGRNLHLAEERVPLRAAEVRMRNEPQRARRAQLEAARLGAVAELNGLRREMLEAAHEEAQRLGFPGYVALCRALSGIDLEAVQRLVQPVLDRTEDAYRDLLAWYLDRRLDVRPRDAQRHDLMRLLRAPDLDAVFGGGPLRESVEAPLRRMGIDPRARGRIRVDADPRATKTSRAFVATLRIPEEVVLVYRPGGGVDDYFAFLHECGHALHFAHTDPALPVEHRRLGDASVAEAWAFLFDGLLRERLWLRRFVGVPQPADVLRFTAFQRLWFLRRYAAKLEYELFLHGEGPGPRAAEAYRELLSGATRVSWPAEMYLADVDPYFYAARYLRAWLFEAQLKTLLRERFDEEWFRNDRTGPFLTDLWRQGQRRTLEELAEQLALGPLSLEPVLEQIMADLG